MRRLLLVAVVVGATILSPSPASAATCFEFTLVPAAPRVGEQATIEAKTLWRTGIDRFALRVWAPDRSTSVVPLGQVGEERWRGTLVFDRPGTWAVQAEIAVPSNEYPCFYRTVEILPNAAPGSGDELRAFALAVGVAVALIAMLVRRRETASKARLARD